MASAWLARVRSDDNADALRSRLTRIRWRRRGAWLWPAFILLTVVDAVVGHLLPPQGETQSLMAAALLGGVLNLLAVILLTAPLAAVLRRFRPSLPKVIARDYAGRALITGVTAALLIAGIVHHPAIDSQQSTMREAIARAEAWIGDRAPAEFASNLQSVSTYAIEPGSIYRMCVSSRDGARSYCVVVRPHLPFQHSVTFAGSEPNAIFAEGTQ